MSCHAAVCAVNVGMSGYGCVAAGVALVARPPGSPVGRRLSTTRDGCRGAWFTPSP
jgi:hypothetical protein